MVTALEMEAKEDAREAMVNHPEVVAAEEHTAKLFLQSHPGVLILLLLAREEAVAIPLKAAVEQAVEMEK